MTNICMGAPCSSPGCLRCNPAQPGRLLGTLIGASADETKAADEAMKVVATGWQPIETAPKSWDQWVILYGGQCQEPYEAARWDADHGWWLTAGGEHWVEGKSYGPTHWMPLPAPPVESKSDVVG